MQAVEELALEGPLKLRVVQIAGMKLEIVGMHGNVRVLKLDDDFDGVAFVAGIEIEQRMFVEPELVKHALETSIGGFWHLTILIEQVRDVCNRKDPEKIRSLSYVQVLCTLASEGLYGDHLYELAAESGIDA